MIPIEQTLVSVPMAVALGLVFGMSACTISCLPYLGPVFLSGGGGIRQSWRILLPFSLGRVSSYAALAATAGFAGQYLGDGVPGLRWLTGAAAIMVGLALLLRPDVPGRRTGCSARDAGDPEGGAGASCRAVADEAPLRPAITRNSPKALMPGGLFLMGAGMSLTPCAPLGVVLFSAATAASAPHGLLLGLGFGTGAIVIPSLIFGIGVAYLGSRLREQLQGRRRYFERLSAALLIFTGIGNLWT